jgi:hypothetical protein
MTTLVKRKRKIKFLLWNTFGFEKKDCLSGTEKQTRLCYAQGSGILRKGKYLQTKV